VKGDDLEFIKKIYHRVRYFILSASSDDFKQSYVSRSVNFIGRKHVSIGQGSVVSDEAWFNVNNRALPKMRIMIGKNCYIGKRNFFSSGQKIDIGDFVMTGINCCFLGADHKVNNPMKPYISTGVTDEKSISIEHNVWLGANVTVLGGVTIGRGAIIGANSLVLEDIPEFSIAVGSPAIVIKRYDFEGMQWVKPGLERGKAPTSKEYLVLLNNNDVSVSKFAAGISYSNLY
jgi:acetyltransferase-like isoleucine patch superfamily enzyme